MEHEEEIEQLALITVNINHECPYKGHSVSLALCYVNSQDLNDPFCYDCDLIPSLKVQHGLRTFERVACPPERADCGARYLYAPRNTEGTSWMVVDLETTERMTLEEHDARRAKNGMARLRSTDRKMVGAPGSDADDILEATRAPASRKAQQKRNSRRRGE